jgi:hypothetical protein
MTMLGRRSRCQQGDCRAVGLEISPCGYIKGRLAAGCWRKRWRETFACFGVLGRSSQSENLSHSSLPTVRSGWLWTTRGCGSPLHLKGHATDMIQLLRGVHWSYRQRLLSIGCIEFRRYWRSIIVFHLILVIISLSGFLSEGGLGVFPRYLLLLVKSRRLWTRWIR